MSIVIDYDDPIPGDESGNIREKEMQEMYRGCMCVCVCVCVCVRAVTGKRAQTLGNTYRCQHNIYIQL